MHLLWDPHMLTDLLGDCFSAGSALIQCRTRHLCLSGKLRTAILQAYYHVGSFISNFLFLGEGQNFKLCFLHHPSTVKRQYKSSESHSVCCYPNSPWSSHSPLFLCRTATFNRETHNLRIRGADPHPDLVVLS